MQSLLKISHRFLASEDGPTAVEYAVMLSLIVVACLTAISSIGTKAGSVFQELRIRSTDRMTAGLPTGVAAVADIFFSLLPWR